jgi:hypothetical protein
LRCKINIALKIDASQMTGIDTFRHSGDSRNPVFLIGYGLRLSFCSPALTLLIPDKSRTVRLPYDIFLSFSLQLSAFDLNG